MHGFLHFDVFNFAGLVQTGRQIIGPDQHRVYSSHIYDCRNVFDGRTGFSLDNDSNFIVGFLGALVPEEQVARWVGGNSLMANFTASFIGCLFYFATLTEIPILEALMRNGMGSGPALALLLAGPALSIPSILVIRSVLGNMKTFVFVVIVVMLSTFVGMGYGALFPKTPTLDHPESA